MNVETLLLQFSTLLSFEEIPLFRGAVLKALSNDSDVLLHNHVEDKYKYACPLVQYKSLDTKASIFCIGEGVDMITKLMRVCNLRVNIGQRLATLKVERVSPQEIEVGIGESYVYHLAEWLPLNEVNDSKFLRLRTAEERKDLLEQILIGNILSVFKSLDFHINDQIECHILNIDRYHLLPCKGVMMRSFDVDFVCNVSLPDYLGIGKHASFGYGTLHRYEQ